MWLQFDEVNCLKTLIRYWNLLQDFSTLYLQGAFYFIEYPRIECEYGIMSYK